MKSNYQPSYTIFIITTKQNLLMHLYRKLFDLSIIIKGFLVLKFINVRTNLNILIRDLLKNWYSAYNNTICPFKLPKFVQHPLESLYFEEWLGISLYKSTSLSVSEWVWLLWNGEFWGMIPLVIQNNLG